MAVFRVEKTRDFTVMSNHHLRNTKLSLKAKGLISLMLSLPEDWDYTTRGLARICKDGVDSICATLKELEQHGYLTRERLRDAHGRLGDIEYTIHEQPVEPQTPEDQPDPPKREKPDQVKPDQAKPDLVKPNQENPAQLNTQESRIKDNQNTHRSNPHGDRLKPGQEITVNHSVSCMSTADIAALTGLPTEKLQDMRESNVVKETAVFEKLCAAVSEWEEIAAQTQLLDRALQYAKTRPVDHTSNQWRRNRYDTGDNISNMVYNMSYNIREETKYDRATQTSVPVAWYVTWDVNVVGAGRNGSGKQIAGQRQKRYTDKAAAEKYLQGRIAAYAHLFKEISPPVPKEYVQHFMVNGQLLPGYTIEGQELKRAAAEDLASGVSVSKAERPSVLGQLAASKAESKAAPTTDPPTKERGPER